MGTSEEPGGDGSKIISGVGPRKEYQREKLWDRKVEGVQATIFIMRCKVWVTAEGKESRREREMGENTESFLRARRHAEILPSYLSK